MAQIENQKILQITDSNKVQNIEFITDDVVEVQRAKLIYYKWVSRLMTFLASLSLIYGVCATLSIMKLAPELFVDPLIVTEVSDSKSLVLREHINPRMESREKVMKNLMKLYVELRNTFIKDEKEMNKRWLWGGLVSYLSSYKIYTEFKEVYPKLTEEMVAKNASRSVEILSIERLGGEKSYVWKVEFKTYDYIHDVKLARRNKIVEPTIEERYWTANIQCKNDYNRRIAYRRLINPLGFIVTGYFQSEIEI